MLSKWQSQLWKEGWVATGDLGGFHMEVEARAMGQLQA